MEFVPKLEKPLAERFTVKIKSPFEFKPESVRRGSLDVIAVAAYVEVAAPFMIASVTPFEI